MLQKMLTIGLLVLNSTNTLASCWAGKEPFDTDLIQTFVKQEERGYKVTVFAPYFFQIFGDSVQSAYNPLLILTTPQGEFTLATQKEEKLSLSPECTHNEGLFTPAFNSTGNEDDPCMVQRRENDRAAEIRAEFYVDELSVLDTMSLHLQFHSLGNHVLRSYMNCAIYISNTYPIHKD